ncbi:MAG: hypothetical protein L0196_03140 [candidate division Zixibacteria bacterium]|nr:hypothetical protein [candidate division Zixibacteria bacterium]
MKLLSNSLFKHQEGFAFIVVLSILALVTGLALVSFSTSDTDRKISANYYETTNAYYAAEAGVVRTCAKLKDSLSWRGTYSGVPVAGGRGKYDVVIYDSIQFPVLKDSLLIKSTGKIPGSPGSESVIEALVAPKKVRRFRYAAFGDTLLRLGGTTLVDAYNSDSGSYSPYGMGGDLGSNDEIYLEGTTDVYGDATTPDTIQSSFNVNIYGTEDQSAPADPLDPITAEEMAYAQANNRAPAGLTLTGGATYNAATGRLWASGVGNNITMVSGTYYYNDIELQSGAQLIIPSGENVIIYLADSLYAAGATLVNNSLKAENLQIYSTGSTVNLTGSAAMYAAIYAPNAQIVVDGNSNLYGSVIGKSVYLDGTAGIHYDRNLTKRLASGGYKVVAWKVL